MGCGESKHAVSTADTISLSKRSSSDAAKDIIVKDVESTNDVKIPQQHVVSTNQSNISKPLNEENKQTADSAAAAPPAGQVFSDADNVVSDNKKEHVQDLKKTDDVVQQTKGEELESESGVVEKIKEDEIKEVAAAAVVAPPPVVDVVVEEVAIKTAEPEAKTEEAHKEDEVITEEALKEDIVVTEEAHKEAEPEKTAEAKESTNVAEEKIPSVEVKVEDSADKNPKST